MAYIVGTDRTQAVLFPEVIDDYISADNPVRFLDAFVAQLDVGALGFQRSVPAAGAGDASQHRADVVAARTATRLQDHR